MSRPKRGDLLSVAIDDLAFGGDGVGRIDGYVVFVRGGIPGDRLRVRLIQAQPRFARGVIEEVEVPSPDRVEAPCPYFGRCGGCRLQHVAYPAQLAFKAKQVNDCLARIGGLSHVRVLPIIGAPEIFAYRNKMEFTIARARRTREGRGGAAPAAEARAERDEDGEVVVGLHEADRYDVVLDIERCLLQSEVLNAVLRDVKLSIRDEGLSVYDQETGEGLLRFLMLREGKRTGEAMVNVVTATPEIGAVTPLAERLRARFPQLASVVLNVNPKKASVAIGVEEHLLAGRDHIKESLGGLSFQISANSFFQTNTLQADRLFALVLEYAGLSGDETVIDLYSGTGAISLLLARRARRVYGIEVAHAAVEDAARNASANGVENYTFLPGEVRVVLPELIRQGIRAEVVVADPPRAGFHPKALKALSTLAPRRIVYVSCNPSTLARDLIELARSGYRIDPVQPIDMFPHTPHIEAVARLEHL